jgi:hypothetical protein
MIKSLLPRQPRSLFNDLELSIRQNLFIIDNPNSLIVYVYILVGFGVARPSRILTVRRLSCLLVKLAGFESFSVKVK